MNKNYKRGVKSFDLYDLQEQFNDILYRIEKIYENYDHMRLEVTALQHRVTDLEKVIDPKYISGCVKKVLLELGAWNPPTASVKVVEIERDPRTTFIPIEKQTRSKRK